MILDTIMNPADLKRLNKDELFRLSVELREIIINTVSENGGHLSSNLGTVELTIALHRVFNSPDDKIIWDVGHQGYTHKLLTGRKDKFISLRKTGGISGFLKREESIHDIFNAGHSSTSISAALGISKANSLEKKDDDVVAVIGDGSLTGGMAFEALNYAGQSKEKIIVVLNDNGMSISKNVGGISKCLSTLRATKKYTNMKKSVHSVLDSMPNNGEGITKSIQNVKSSLKNLFIPGMFFENLGFTYFGTIDGHNIEEIEKYLEMAKKVEGSVILHVITKKGKGYLPAEKSPDMYHGVGKFKISEGISPSNSITYSNIFGNTMVELGNSNEKLICFTAAMCSGTGLSKFEKEFPTRFIDVGIAEQHAVTMAASLALQGYTPVFAVYSTFLQRAYDQIMHDVCLQNAPVVFAIDRAGIVGNDGETHHGIFDISYLIHMPNMKIFAPKDGWELSQMLKNIVFKNEGPVAIRYPRGKALKGDFNEFDIYKPNVLRTGKSGLVIACGNMVEISKRAIDELISDKIRLTLIDPRILKPLDISFYKDILKDYDMVVTIEENSVIGGFGSYFSGEISKLNLDIKVKNIGIEDNIISHGDTNDLLKIAGLDFNSIKNKLKDIFKE